MKTPHIFRFLLMLCATTQISAAGTDNIAIPDDSVAFSWGPASTPVKLLPTMTASERHRTVACAIKKNRRALIELFADCAEQRPSAWLTAWLERVSFACVAIDEDSRIAHIKSRISDWKARDLAQILSGVEAVGTPDATTADCVAWVDLLTRRRGPHNMGYLFTALSTRGATPSAEGARHVCELLRTIQESSDSEGVSGEDRECLRPICFEHMQSATLAEIVSTSRSAGAPTNPPADKLRDALTAYVNEVLRLHEEGLTPGDLTARIHEKFQEARTAHDTLLSSLPSRRVVLDLAMVR